MRANVKFNIVDEINHVVLTHAFATMCGESVTTNTSRWIGLNVHAGLCPKCKEACSELIASLQACIAPSLEEQRRSFDEIQRLTNEPIDWSKRPKDIYKQMSL